ncbi:unnamed protein product, partial [Closterium sp. NIES-54]
TAATATAATATATAATAAAIAATTVPTCCATMASLRVLTFDQEGRPVQIDTWLDDLQLYLLSDSKDSVSLFDLASGAATAGSATRSQWLTRDAAARLAIRNHLPLAECAHFGQHRTAQALYTAVVARDSLPTTAALGRLLLPYLFPELPAFATVEDLVSHLRTSDARYRATVPAEVDLLEQHILAAKTSVVAKGAARGTPCPPSFEGCSPSPLAPFYASAAAAAADISASAKCRNTKVKGGRCGGGGSGGGGGGSGSGGGGSSGGSEGSGGGGGSGTGGGSGGSGGGGGGGGGSGGSGGGGTRGNRTGTRHGGPGAGQRQQGEGDCYRCVPPGPGIAAAALGASESGTLPGTAPAQALHTFTLDSGASRCFFCDSTTLTPIPVLVPVRLADPSGGPVIDRSSTVLPCPPVPSGSLSGLHLPSFSTKLMSTAALQDAMVTTTTPRGQRVSICTSTRTGLHVATFTRRPGSSLYTLATKPPQVAASAQVSASLPPLPPSSAPPYLPCVEGRQHTAPHSSSFNLTTTPMQTLHMDQNGIVERRIGLVMEVACTSMIHAAAPHFLWRFVVWYAAHQLNLWPRVSLLETSPTLRWTGEVGDASVFRVWGSRGFVRDTSADKLSTRAIPCDVTFNESVPFYRLFPYCSAPPPPPPLFLAPGPPPVDPLPPQGPAPLGVSKVDPLLGTAPLEVHVGSGAAPGAASGGAASGGGEPGGAGFEGAGSGGAEPGGEEPGGAESEGAESGGAEPRGATSSGAPGAGGAGVTAGAGGFGGPTAAGRGGARTRGAGAAKNGGVGGVGAGDPTEPGTAGAGSSYAGGAGAGGIGAGGAGVGGIGAGGTVRPRPYFVPLFQQSQPPLQSASPLSAPSPYTEKSGGLTERCEPASRPVSRVRTARRTPRSRPPPVSGTHTMALRPSSVPMRVPLPAPLESSILEVPDPESDLARAASPTVSHLLATAITDPSFESAAASALVAELLDCAAACRLDYATALVAQSASASPLSSAAAMDAKMASWKSTSTYVDEVPPPEANILDGMWIFRVKQLPGSPPAFKARYVTRGFSQRQEVDDFQTFSPTPKMTTLAGVAARRCSALHEEIWLRRPLGFTWSFPAGTQWILRRPVYGLRQAPRKWHDMLRTTLAALGFAPSTADPSLFLRTDTSLLPFYVLVYVDDLVFATADTETLTLVKSELQKRHT